jgi:transposase-like protein
MMDRGIRLALEAERPIANIAQDLGIHPEALLKRVRRAEIDAGKRDGLGTTEREELSATPTASSSSPVAAASSSRVPVDSTKRNPADSHHADFQLD